MEIFDTEQEANQSKLLNNNDQNKRNSEVIVTNSKCNSGEIFFPIKLRLLSLLSLLHFSVAISSFSGYYFVQFCNSPLNSEVSK